MKKNRVPKKRFFKPKNVVPNFRQKQKKISDEEQRNRILIIGSKKNIEKIIQGLKHKKNQNKILYILSPSILHIFIKCVTEFLFKWSWVKNIFKDFIQYIS
jgi:hypothetical protein